MGEHISASWHFTFLMHDYEMINTTSKQSQWLSGRALGRETEWHRLEPGQGYDFTLFFATEGRGFLSVRELAGL